MSSIEVKKCLPLGRVNSVWLSFDWSCPLEPRDTRAEGDTHPNIKLQDAIARHEVDMVWIRVHGEAPKV